VKNVIFPFLHHISKWQKLFPCLNPCNPCISYLTPFSFVTIFLVSRFFLFQVY
jgi:hypothetical protein